MPALSNSIFARGMWLAEVTNIRRSMPANSINVLISLASSAVVDTVPVRRIWLGFTPIVSARLARISPLVED